MYVKKKKNYIWNPATFSCENGKYLATIMDDSAITCDEIIEETFPTNFKEKKQAVTHKISIFCLHYYYLLQHY